VVGEHIGGDPAEPEYHHRAEHRFLHDADDGLDAAGDHGLDQHCGHPPAEAGVQSAHRGAYLVVSAQVQFDGASRRLVQQAWYLAFDHHVTAQAGRRLDGGVGVGGPAERHHGEAITAQQTVSLLGGQPPAARQPRQERIDDRAGVRRTHVGELGHGAGRPGPPGAVPGGPGQGPGGRLGVSVRGHGRAGILARQQPDGLGLIQHHRRDRDRQPGGGEHREHVSRGIPHDHRDQGGDAVGGGEVQCLAEGLRGDGRGGVHRAGEGCPCGQHVAQAAAGLRAGRGHDQAGFRARIGREHARAPAVGHDSHRVARRYRLGREQHGQVK